MSRLAVWLAINRLDNSIGRMVFVSSSLDMCSTPVTAIVVSVSSLMPPEASNLICPADSATDVRAGSADYRSGVCKTQRIQLALGFGLVRSRFLFFCSHNPQNYAVRYGEASGVGVAVGFAPTLAILSEKTAL